ncbi:MAG: uroporphyrinogen decarboxylase family protein [bacterium]
MMSSIDKGFNYEASCRRICDTYRRENVDRVPILSPLWQFPRGDIDSAKFGDWRDEDRFRELVRFVQASCDPLPPYNAVGFPHVFESWSYQRFLEAPREYVEEFPDEEGKDNRTRHTVVLHTPKGDLKWVYENEVGVLTNWDMHRPVQCIEDVEKLLSVPYKFKSPDPKEYEAFRKHRAKMGADAISGAGINSMVAMLCGVMPFELLLEWVITEPDIIKRLADTWLERTSEKVDWLLSQGVGPFWHFNGVERASPPMMGPNQWDELVIPYDGDIMRRIKAADSEARIHVHCHGNVETLLDSFVEMGVDSIDPVEPHPQGDVDIAKVKRKYDNKLVFVGNIEFLDMETKNPGEMDEIVQYAIEGGGKENVMLWTSSGPHERPTDRFLDNAVHYIEAGLKYGKM